MGVRLTASCAGTLPEDMLPARRVLLKIGTGRWNRMHEVNAAKDAGASISDERTKSSCCTVSGERQAGRVPRSPDLVFWDAEKVGFKESGCTDPKRPKRLEVVGRRRRIKVREIPVRCCRRGYLEAGGKDDAEPRVAMNGARRFGV